MDTLIPTLRADPLILRPLQLSDAETLHRINKTEDVLRYFPNQMSPALEKIEHFITGQQAHWENYGYGNWGVLPDGESKIIGWAGLQYLPELDETEVGFLLDCPFWGKGYATQAGRASIHYGFTNFGFDHIIALVHPDNLASRRVIAKCSMTYVDTLSLWGMELMRFRVERQGAIHEKSNY